MFDQLMICTVALNSQTNTPKSNGEEKKIKGVNKSSAILAKFCMQVSENRSQHGTSRNPNIDVVPSSEIEKIKTRLDQKLHHGAQKHSPVDHGYSKANDLSPILQPVSRFPPQDSVIRTSSLHARDHSVQVSDRLVLSGSKRQRCDHVVKKEKMACPRCGRWCKYACQGATTSSSLVVVCVNCGKRFQPKKKEWDES